MESHVLILAGGLGTRLRSVVPDTPKVLAPVLGKPFLFWLLDKLYKSGVNNVCLLLGYKSEEIVDLVKFINAENSFPKMSLTTSIENEQLGTGGAVANCLENHNLRGDFILLNGDTWLSGDLGPIFNAECNTLGMKFIKDTSRFGSIDVDNGYVEGFFEKKDCGGCGNINLGIYKLCSEAFLPWFGKKFSLELDFVPDLILQKNLKAIELEVEFLDIGIPEDYFMFVERMRLYSAE